MRDRRGHLRRAVVQVPPTVPDLAGARSVVLVEGVSDQIAIAAAARQLGRDLAAEGVVVLCAQGVGNFAKLAATVGARLSGLCDLAEVPWVCRALVRAGKGMPQTQGDLADMGFYACDRDLEDELIRALGPESVQDMFHAQGDLAAFHTLQRQGPWKAAALTDQIRRFLGSGAGRKPRYARLLTEALPSHQLPAPLRRVLDRV